MGARGPHFRLFRARATREGARTGRFLIRFWSAVALGAVYATVFAPMHWFAAGFVAFGGLVTLIAGASSVRMGFVLGWGFGFGSFAVGLHWIVEAFSVDAERFGVYAWPSLFALAASLAVFPGLATAVAAAVTKARVRWTPLSVLLAVTWAISEWLRANVLGGFPWNVAGYAWGGSDVMLQSAGLFGIHGAGFVAVLVWLLPFAALRDRSAGPAMVAGALGGALWFYGEARLATPSKVAPDPPIVRIINTDIPQKDKWRESERGRIVDTLVNLSIAETTAVAKPKLVFWPEAAVPMLIDEDADARARIAGALPEDGFLLTGAIRREIKDDGSVRWHNSLLALGPDGNVAARYDKVRLVPFGEYMPFRSWLARIPRLGVGETDFSPGTTRATIVLPGLPSIWPAICYESIFSDFPQEGEPAFIFAATNDAWFGGSWGPYQHFLAARVLAIELGLPLVRSANGGISAMIDGEGRVLKALPPNNPGIIDAMLPSRLQPRAPYRWAGDWLFAAMVISAFGYALIVLAPDGRRR